MSRYLDNASTSPLSKSVMGDLDTLSMMWFNPSSKYPAARYNKQVIENVRQKIADTINAKPEEIIFTSSGSEANTLAIDGFLKANPECECIASAIEHSSIIKNPNVERFIDVDSKGIIAYDSLTMFNDFKNTLVSCQLINNEIGSIQPIIKIAEVVHAGSGLIHCDCVQAFGKYPIDVKELDVDMASFSGHKIGSIRGVGFLYVREGIKLSPIIHGEQENGLRGGTYNDLAIKTLGLAIDDIDYRKEMVISSRRDYLLKKLSELDCISVNGSIEHRCSSNINILIRNISIDGEQIVSMLEENGWMLSQGSACNEMNKQPSHVLKAIGLSDDEISHSIRITINEDNSVQDLDDFYEDLKNIIEMFKK